jgi:hypothetical protein
MTSIIAYDSAAPNNIPLSAPAVLPYIDGFAWSNSLRPRARYRYITIHGNWPHASIFDVEAGAISVDELPSLVHNRNANHNDDSIVYCTRSTVASVQSILGNRPWKLFLATLDGSQPRSWNGKPTAAVQYWGGATAPYDKSIWWDETDLHRP